MILFRLHNITLLEAVKHWNVFWSYSSRLVNVKFKVKRAILKRTWLHSAKIKKTKNTFAPHLYFYYGCEIVSGGQSHPERTVTIDQSMYGAPVLFVDTLKWSNLQQNGEKKKRSPEKSWGHSRLRCCGRTFKSDVLQCCEEKPEFLLSDVRDW